MNNAMTVEIHDVTPALWTPVLQIERKLREVGVERPTLLVVPAYVDADGKRWDLRDAPEIVEQLRWRQLHGFEIIQHGLSHRAEQPPPRGLRNAAMHRWFSRGEAEFAHLDATRAERRLLCGRRIFGQCGLRAGGFVAPAWQQSSDAIGAVKRLGFSFTAFLDGLVCFGRRVREIHAPALTFAAASGVIDRGKRGVMRCIEALSRYCSLLRVALHPADLTRPGLVEHIIERIGALRGRRELTSYAQWLAR